MPDIPRHNYEVPVAKLEQFMNFLREERLEEAFLDEAPTTDAHPAMPAAKSASRSLNVEAFRSERTVTARELAATANRFVNGESDLADGSLVVDARLVEFAKVFVERHDLIARSALAGALHRGDCERLGFGRNC